MINWEGTLDSASEVACPQILDSIHHGDDSPLSLGYSSCGESELDRYCSANSVMDTPSMCSAITVYNDCVDSEFGSLRSVGTPDDDFNLGGRVERSHTDRRLLSSVGSDCVGDSRIGFYVNNHNYQRGIKYGASGLELYGNDNEEPTMLDDRVDGVCDRIGIFGLAGASSFMEMEKFRSNLDGQLFRGDDEGASTMHREQGGLEAVGDYLRHEFGDRVDNYGSTNGYLCAEKEDKMQFVPEIIEDCSSCEIAREAEVDRLGIQSDAQFGEKREIEKGNMSDYQHSDGDESIHNYGMDKDSKIDPYIFRSMHSLQEAKIGNENPLLINSSVAFGSQDWDDFELETVGNGHVSQTFDIFHKENRKNLPISLSAVSSPSDSPKEKQINRKDAAIVMERVKDANEVAKNGDNCSENPLSSEGLEETEIKHVTDMPFTYNHVQDDDKSNELTLTSSNAPENFPNTIELRLGDIRDIFVSKTQIHDDEKSFTCSKTACITNISDADLDPLADKTSLKKFLSSMDDSTAGKGHKPMGNEEAIKKVEVKQFGSSKSSFGSLSDVIDDKIVLFSSEPAADTNAGSVEDHKAATARSDFDMQRAIKSPPAAADLLDHNAAPAKMGNSELNEFYDEVVHEMEEILLDSVDSPAARISQGNRVSQSQLSLPLRDGGATASTSETEDTYLLVRHPMKIDGVEVVGAIQKRGDVSFSERLVGVKEYTVYKIRVWSGKDQWEVERRYRDFVTLYHQMKTLFIEQGWVLPSPWTSVGKESRKLFGSAAPDVIVERSVLIQDCLRSILHARFFSSLPSALIWFLSPQDSYPSSHASNTLISELPVRRRASARDLSALGKTISLIVEIHPCKSMKQMLEAQHYSCAGCHNHFEDGKTLIQDFVQSFGWGKPRLCEYTGQLFCSSCHTNDMAVLPARILHHWDFSTYPVSQLAKSYLDSIHDQPMLCVSAVNPFLFSKVPALLHVMGVRRKIGAMLPYVRCPFRKSINRGLGSRRYLLEGNDFFALRDLIDLSKGAFAVLPVMVENVSRKILEHITEQCLICCDVGVPCNARQDCNDASSLIFPFQDGEVEKCSSCGAVFHKPCFKKLASCPCGTRLKTDETMGLTKIVSNGEGSEMRSGLNLLGRSLTSRLSGKILSGLFTKENPENARENKDNDNVILMGSMPSTSL